MKYEELLDIVKTGEGFTIEFKQSLNSSIGKEICAFANSIGGKIRNILVNGTQMLTQSLMKDKNGF